MKTVCVLGGAAALAATVAASPLSRVSKRAPASVGYPSKMKKWPGQSASPMSNVTEATVQYDSNWAGVAYSSAPSGTWTSVTGTFNLPDATAPDDGNQYGGSAWVGIDGYGDTQDLVQSGCQWTVQDGEDPQFACWTEWIPDPPVYFDDFDANTGDQITVTVTINSETEAVAQLSNSNGGSTSRTFSAPSSDATVVGANAEWIVEDFSEGDGLAPFANFGTVTFTGCSATADGQQYGTSGGDIVEIVNSDQTETETTVSVPDDQSVQVVYQTEPLN